MQSELSSDDISVMLTSSVLELSGAVSFEVLFEQCYLKLFEVNPGVLFTSISQFVDKHGY